MGKIDELINQLCLCGVKRVKLVDYAKVQYGFAFNSKLFTDDSANIPLIRIRDVLPGKSSTYYLGEYSDEYIVKKGDILVGMDGNFNLEKWNDRNGLLNQRVCKIFTKDARMLLDGFLYHYLKPVLKKIENSIQGSTVKHLSAKVINGMEIPLPSIAVQEKIVGILDTLTGMIDNLQKELEQRQKQFEHYRDQLLTFKEGEVQIKPIKEIGKLVRGNGLQKKDFTEDGTGCIHYGQIYTRFGLSTSSTLAFVDSQLAAKLTKVSPGDLVIACTSENIEDVCKSVAWLGKEDIVTGGHACVFKHSENPKYIAYCFTTSAFFLQKRKYAYGAKVIDIKTEKLGEITLPIPSLDKQQEIVGKLDTFEGLISNIKQEIELRQKQYEFYREKLLSFE